MSGFVVSLLLAFGVVFLAELGDKSQLLAVTFGSRYPLRIVALGLFLGFAAAGAVAALVGGLIGASLAERPIEVVSGTIFVIFGLGSLRPGSSEATAGISIRSVIVSIALTIAMAEMGDKTQIATATLAANTNPGAVWIGATAGETASAMIGALAGNALGDRISARTLRLASASLFLVFGAALLMGWP